MYGFYVLILLLSSRLRAQGSDDTNVIIILKREDKK